ncbi:MAG: RNA polymerase sigma factor [Ruminococcus sp.]|nr:RNA polymerase sigma factor [Ruminococcus sp.]
MDDSKIIELYWQRNEKAIETTAKKYGSYCMKISYNILSDLSDSDENVNDTYMQAWKSIPPARPDSLMAYLGKLARNLALNKLKARNAQKRSADSTSVSLDELDLYTPSGVNIEDEAEMAQLSRCISDFLYTQKEDARNVFVCRYFYCDSIEDIAQRFSFSQSKVKSMLMRTREKLRDYLLKEGYDYGK